MLVYITGVVHGDGAPLSTEHVSADAFAALNEKVAEDDEVVAAGPERMLTVGGSATVHGYDAVAESDPELAVMVNVCAPGAMPVYVTGALHGAGVPESIEQVSPDAFAATNEKAADVDEVVEGGPERMFTVGGGVTVHEYEALVESEPELAVTVNICEPGAMPAYAAGVEHGAGAPASIAQASADAFVAETENEADVDVVVAPGPERIVTVGGGAVAGGAEVTVQVASACADPLALATRMARVWVPTDTPLSVVGDVHAHAGG
jgi:hypothetical protein